MRRFIVIILVFLATVVAFAEEQEFVYDAKSKRDPFWKLVSPKGIIINYDTDLLVSDLAIEGIIFDPGGNSLAIINGKVVKPKEKIGLFFISEIEKDRVFLIKGQETFVLELKKEE